MIIRGTTTLFIAPPPCCHSRQVPGESTFMVTLPDVATALRAYSVGVLGGVVAGCVHGAAPFVFLDVLPSEEAKPLWQESLEACRWFPKPPDGTFLMGSWWLVLLCGAL